MLNPGQLKRGLIVEIDGAPCSILAVDVQTPSSRGANTLWKVRARNLKTKQKVDAVYKGGDTIPEPNFEKRAVQFLYRDAAHLHFMDLSDYNQFTLSLDGNEEEASYLIDNLEGIAALVVDDEVIGIELPNTVDLAITECAPAVKGSSSSGRTKPATLETGLVVQVPEHIGPGDVVRIDTSDGRFLQRVQH